MTTLDFLMYHDSRSPPFSAPITLTVISFMPARRSGRGHAAGLPPAVGRSASTVQMMPACAIDKAWPHDIEAEEMLALTPARVGTSSRRL